MDGKAAAGMPPTLAAAAAGAGGVPSTGGSASGGAWCSKWGYRLYTRCMMRRPMAVVFNCTECGKMASVKCNAGESRETSKRVRDHMKGIPQFNNIKKFTIKRSTNSKRSHQIKQDPKQIKQDPKQIKLTLFFVGDTQRSLHDIVGVLVVQHLGDRSGVRQFSNDQSLGRTVGSMETFFNDLCCRSKK